MTSSSPLSFPSPHLSASGFKHLQAALDKAASDLPGCFLVVASANKVLFNGHSSPFNVLYSHGSRLNGETIIWISSATRFVLALSKSFSSSLPLQLPSYHRLLTPAGRANDEIMKY